jgi:RimJ/RimL family protein N-acetyltransferase
VRLRGFTEADITEAYLGWLNDPVVTRYSNQRFVRHDRSSCLRYLASFTGSRNLFLSVERLDDNRAIGTMTAYVSEHHGTVDVGILIGDRSVWGKGCGQDAWDTLTGWLLAQPYVRKVTAGTLAANTGMIRLAEKSGMTFEGRRVRQEIVEGEEVDILHYGRFRET